MLKLNSAVEITPNPKSIEMDPTDLAGFSELKDGFLEDVRNIIAEKIKNQIPLAVVDAENLIELATADELLRNLGGFLVSDHKQIAEEMIAKYHGRELLRHLDLFTGLDHNELAQYLLESEHTYLLAEYLQNFKGLDHSALAAKMIKMGQGRPLAQNLKNFAGLDHKKIAEQLLETDQGEYLAESLGNFSGLDEQIAQQLFALGAGSFVAQHMASFSGLDHVKVALRLMETEEVSFLEKYIGNFRGLNDTVALKFINSGRPGVVMTNLGSFSGLDKKIVMNLIDINALEVAKGLEHLDGLHKNAAAKLIETGMGWSVAKNLNRFKRFNEDVFNGISHDKLATALIRAGDGKYVAMYLGNFTNANRKKIALALIEAGDGKYISRHPENLNGLDDEVMQRLAAKA